MCTGFGTAIELWASGPQDCTAGQPTFGEILPHTMSEEHPADPSAGIKTWAPCSYAQNPQMDLAAWIPQRGPWRPGGTLGYVQACEGEGLHLSSDSGTKTAKGLFVHSTGIY